MKARIWLGLLALVAMLSLTAMANAAAGKDVLVIGVSSDIQMLDPGVSSDNYDWREIYVCYDRLVKYKTIDGKGSTEVEPMAAESWTVSPDGLVWTFKIRKDIAFDDGAPLDAKAVKFSLERTLKIGKGPADNISAISAIEVADPYTVKITLKNAYAPFLQTLATNGASIVNPAVMKYEKDGDLAQGWMAANVDGSGPYKVKEWIRGERVVLDAKAKHWAGVPKIKRVVIRFMRESADRRMALERGDIDIAEGILIDQLPALQKNKDISVVRYPSQLVEYVYLNCQKDNLKNKLVRQALSYAVDYDGIIKHVLQGYGVQMRGAIPVGMWGHDPKTFQYKRDVKKAKELLKKAGYEKGLTLTLSYSERRSSWEQIATVLQANLKDIGVDLKLEMVANPTLREKISRGDFELCLGAWSPDFADPYMFMNFWFDSKNFGTAGNRAFYKNDKVDELVRKAAEVADQKTRVKLYKQAQDIVLEEPPYLFLYQTETVVTMRKNVKGYVFNPMLESMYNFESMSKQ